MCDRRAEEEKKRADDLAEQLEQLMSTSTLCRQLEQERDALKAELSSERGTLLQGARSPGPARLVLRAASERPSFAPPALCDSRARARAVDASGGAAAVREARA